MTMPPSTPLPESNLPPKRYLNTRLKIPQREALDTWLYQNGYTGEEGRNGHRIIAKEATKDLGFPVRPQQIVEARIRFRVNGHGYMGFAKMRAHGTMTVSQLAQWATREPATPPAQAAAEMPSAKVETGPAPTLDRAAAPGEVFTRVQVGEMIAEVDAKWKARVDEAFRNIGAAHQLMAEAMRDIEVPL
jgi:hypothetical protein